MVEESELFGLEKIHNGTLNMQEKLTGFYAACDVCDYEK